MNQPSSAGHNMKRVAKKGINEVVETVSITKSLLGTLISGGAKAVRDSFVAEKPDELTKNGGLHSVDIFSKHNIEDSLAVIAIGGESKNKPRYPSSTIAQMALWTIRKQGKSELPVTISLNISPGLIFNEIDKDLFYSEKEQRERIIKDMSRMGATKEEFDRVKFELSSQNPPYLSLIGSIQKGSLNDFPLYKALHDAFLEGGEFSKDIKRCIPEQVKSNGNNEITFHYALIEIYQIIEDYKKGLKIKIGYKREKLYDQIYINILNGNYPELLNISDSINPINENGRTKGNELFGSVHWDERADENSKKLRLKNIAQTRFKQLLFATPIVISTIIGGGYFYKASYEKMKKNAILEVKFSELRKNSDKFRIIDELNKTAKGFDYKLKNSEYTLSSIYEGNDYKLGNIMHISSNIALYIIDVNQSIVNDQGMIYDKYNKPRERSIQSRWLELEIANIISEKAYDKYVSHYDILRDVIHSDLLSILGNDARFSQIFEISTGEKWTNTQEQKLEVFKGLYKVGE
ncbi:MAG: hypothetical protein PHS92_04910 [Candidatus Gracilibacteria bacterium]|nr:hypothetical protein [Candidatus Gracilibacteria bacterium]